ncbi:hypothetical protein Patl1_31586 [Pistacia atlantica]|uniref:Uncharacterized protein n=1 Tax=Pistacia atlantica TaxID=434234 RepID=A0ACC1AMC5_9ROSI|nr:hypothetical protein Patl1_31586 [Pistacia atlantica]
MLLLLNTKVEILPNWDHACSTFMSLSATCFCTDYSSIGSSCFASYPLSTQRYREKSQ